MTDNIEIQLVESAIGGDIDSFGELAGLYYSAMVAIAYAVLLDHHLAEDAAQEALARALVKLPSLRHKDKFGYWLGRICRNVARDMVRKKARLINAEDLSQIPAQQPKDDGRDMVREAVSKLSASARELIVLRYYNNLSYEQMSAVLGITPAAINSRLYRAKQKIEKFLQRNRYLEKKL